MTEIDFRFKRRYGRDNRRPRWVGFFKPLGGVLLLLLMSANLSACRAWESNDPSDGRTATTPAPSQALAPNPTASPIIPSCFQQPGVIVEETLTSPLLPRELDIRLYLPPCYDEDRPRPYPVLYLFHGLGDSDEQWPRLGVVELADERLMNRQAEPFLIVMPWERSGQDMVTAVLEVLLPYIESSYHVRTDRDGRAMGGISRGGGWVLSVAAQAPDVFGSIGLHSTGVLDSFPYLQLRLEEPWSTLQPRIWIDVGERDSLMPRALELLDLFDRLGLEYTWRLNPGEHSDAYWSSYMDEYLDWYLQGW